MAGRVVVVDESSEEVSFLAYIWCAESRTKAAWSMIEKMDRRVSGKSSQSDIRVPKPI